MMIVGKKYMVRVQGLLVLGIEGVRYKVKWITLTAGPKRRKGKET